MVPGVAEDPLDGVHALHGGGVVYVCRLDGFQLLQVFVVGLAEVFQLPRMLAVLIAEHVLQVVDTILHEAALQLVDPLVRPLQLSVVPVGRVTEAPLQECEALRHGGVVPVSLLGKREPVELAACCL